jgi:uncharacterized membrane protein
MAHPEAFAAAGAVPAGNITTMPAPPRPPAAPGLATRAAAWLHERNPSLGAQLVVAVTIALDLGLPDRITIGPAWLMPSLEGVLMLGLLAVSWHPSVRNHPGRRRVAMAMIGLVSLVNLISLSLLVYYLVHHGTNNGRALILAGVVLWVTNVLLFGLWYWQVDRGGPIERDRGTPNLPDFLFPQMADVRLAAPDWKPGLIDYLYVSFTNATAFSPTDTMPLTKGVKLLMAIQSLASLLLVGLVVARAVNILQ